MEENLVKIEEVCGVKPTNQEFIIVENDPNFIFVNDPSFNTLRLYDTEGNIINVNSWIECANYVNGGWSDNLKTFINYEKYLFFVLLIATFSYIGAKYLIQIRSKNFKK